jgi:chromosome segregation ATPase
MQIMGINKLKDFLRSERTNEAENMLQGTIKHLRDTLVDTNESLTRTEQSELALQALYDEVRDTLGGANRKLGVKVIENENLTCDVEASRNDLVLRVGEVERMTKSNNELRSEVADLGETKRAIDKENLDLRASNTGLYLNITELKCEIDRLNGMLGAAKGDSQSVRDELDLLNAKLDKTLKELNFKDQKLGTAHDQLLIFQGDITDLTAEKNDINSDLKKANKRLLKYERDEQSLTAEKEKIHSLNSQLEALVQELKGRINGLDKDLKKKKAEWELMLKDIQKLDKEKSKYFNEVQRLEELLELARGKEHDSKSSLDKSAKEKEYLLRRIQELEDDLSKLEKTNGSLKGRLQDELAALEQLRADYKIASEGNFKMKSLVIENDKLYQDIADFKLALADKQTFIETLNDEITRLTAAHLSQLKIKDRDITDMTAKLRQMSFVNDDLSSDLELTNAELASLKQIMGDLGDQLDKSKQENSLSEEELRKLQTEKNLSEEELELLRTDQQNLATEKNSLADKLKDLLAR